MRVEPPTRAVSKYSPLAGIKLPCWPGASLVTVIFTNGIYRVIVYFSVGPLFAFILLFAFEKQADTALHLFGYDNDFISSFPFIRSLYFHLTSARWIGRLDVGYFHLLDATVWLSLGVWGTWLIAGLAFLKQYDDLFQKRLILLSERIRGREVLYYVGWIGLILAPSAITYFSMQDKILRDADIVFIIKRLPGLYFYVFAIVYFYNGAFFSTAALIFAWKLFRQKRRGVILWREELEVESEARAS